MVYCAVVQGNAPIELDVIYKGECKMEGYNFAPFAIRERSDVLFNLIKYDSKSSLSLKNAYSNKEMVYQDGGNTKVAYYNYEEVTKGLFRR